MGVGGGEGENAKSLPIFTSFYMHIYPTVFIMLVTEVNMLLGC